MAEQFNEAWEFYVPDPEVAELFAERQEEVDRAATTDHKKFMFRFEGNADMTAGRFFDGILFGTQKHTPIFSWGISDVYRESSLVRAFEKTVDALPGKDRGRWLSEKAVKAWQCLPERNREIMVAMVAVEPPPRTGRRGKPPGPLSIVQEMFDASKCTIYRYCLRTRIFMMREMIDPAFAPRCECGCGNFAPIAYVDSRKYGHDVFEPVRFCTGHPWRTIS